MKPHLSLLAAVLTLVPALTDGASSDDLGFEIASNLPVEVWQQIHATSVLNDYKLSARLNPFYLQADFDGDGRRDVAVLVQHSISKLPGIAVFHASKEGPFILGSIGPAAGSTGYASIFNAWHVMERGPVRMGADQTTPPTLRGDALVLKKLEASSVIMYWTATSYATYWQGD